MKGKWIWLDSRVYPQYQRGRNTFFCPMESKFCVATFVRCIEAETDTRVRIRMAADTKYVLWIDGKRALRAASGQSGDYDDRGPASSFEYDTLFFDWERGEHCVRVDVLGSPQMVGEVSKGRGGLWAEITLELQGGGKNRDDGRRMESLSQRLLSRSGGISPLRLSGARHVRRVRRGCMARRAAARRSARV